MSVVSNYLGTYALSSSGNSTYTLNFTIPDNCNFRSTGSNGIFCVDIDLNSGQTQPSTNFVPCSQVYAPYQNTLQIAFDQPTGGSKKLRKPIIDIDA